MHDQNQLKRFSRHLSRRQALAAGAGVAVAALPAVTRAQATPASGEDATPASGEWTYTDDAGKTVTLPAMPTRVVADLNAATALWDFGVRPIAVSGWTVTSDDSWGNVDRDTPVINASDAAPEPDFEQLISLGAELFVTIHYPEDSAPYVWSFSEESSVEQAEQIMPVVGVSVSGRADENLESFKRLAGLLGVDLESPELIEALAVYEATKDDFETVAAEKSDLTSLFVGARGDEIYVANPPDWADLNFFASLGLNIMAPDVEPNTWWETLSAEQALTYQSDVLYQSFRGGLLTHEEIAEHPTIGQLPAVKAGQVGTWQQDFIQSYQGLTTAMELVLEPLRTAEKVTE